MDSKDTATKSYTRKDLNDLIKYLKAIENLNEEGRRRLQKEMRRYNGL